MTMVSGFELTLNFATLYLDKTQSLYFSRWRSVSIMGYKIFMTSFKILKSLWIFELIVKKIHINYKIFSQTSIFLL
jgi:hypothetical protein